MFICSPIDWIVCYMCVYKCLCECMHPCICVETRGECCVLFYHYLNLLRQDLQTYYSYYYFIIIIIFIVIISAASKPQKPSSCLYNCSPHWWSMVTPCFSE